MNNNILEFLEAYKSLDDLCKQILSNDRGISQYIDEMNHEGLGPKKVDCWEKDYRQLKKMRWIRNQLVHEIYSFQEDLINTEDIEWLLTFRSRIMECTDPFSLLYQSQNSTRKTIKQNKDPENLGTNKTFYNWNLVYGVIISIGIIILAITFLAIFV